MASRSLIVSPESQWSARPAAARSDPEPWRDSCVFRNHDDPVADVIIFRVEIFRFPLRRNHNSVGNACVFVDDSAIDYAIAADYDGNFLRTAIATEFVKISAHHHAVANGCAALNDAAHSDNAALDVAIGYDAAVGNNCLAQGRAVDLAPREKPGMSVNRRVGFEKTVGWNQVGEIEIGFVKGANRSDIFPVAVENKGTDAMRLDRSRDDVLAKVEQVVVEALDQHVAIEDVNSHRRLKQFLIGAVPDCRE